MFLLVRIMCLGIALATFVLQLEPNREFRSATISFDGVGYADYRALYLTYGKVSYPILYADEKVYHFVFSHMNGGEVQVLLRPDDGIVEMRSGKHLVFSVDDYIKARDASNSVSRKWMIGSLLLFLGTFLIRRSFL